VRSLPPHAIPRSRRFTKSSSVSLAHLGMGRWQSIPPPRWNGVRKRGDAPRRLVTLVPTTFHAMATDAAPDQTLSGSVGATNLDRRTKKVSAIVACYRDAQACPIMHERLTATFKKCGIDYEIIFVNDASPDDAGAVLAAIAEWDPKTVVINHSRNFGSQSAFTSGMRIATGDAVVLLDGDLQDPPELIEQFIEKWELGYDVVYGIRNKRQASTVLRIGYKLFYRIFRAASYVPIPLDAGDFSLLDRRVVQAINNLPEHNRFIRGLRAWVGFQQTGVTYTRPERMFGRTTNSLLRNIGWARKGVFSFSYAPLEVITVVAVVTIIGSVLASLVTLTIRLVRPDLAPSGLTTVILIVLFLGGVQLACLSIIGSYLAHVYDEVKQRPPFIVESILNSPSSLELEPRNNQGDPPTPGDLD
jgi:polyisoprenyl-phosphate glycosyltransferase